MKKFEIIIKDLETGEELILDQTGCIIGAFATEKDGESATAALAFNNCKTQDTLMTIMGVEKIAKESKNRLVKSFFERMGGLSDG